MKLSNIALLLLTANCVAAKNLRTNENRKLSTSSSSSSSSGSSSGSSSSDSSISCLEAVMRPSNGGLFPNVRGTVEVCFDGSLSATSGTLNMSVRGLQSGIIDGGVHVHAGTSCESSTTQQGHYFNGPDPWFNAKNPAIAPDGTSYSTNGSGRGTSNFQFDQGYGYGDTIGKVIVIHESFASGYQRIACGILEVV